MFNSLAAQSEGQDLRKSLHSEHYSLRTWFIVPSIRPQKQSEDLPNNLDWLTISKLYSVRAEAARNVSMGRNKPTPVKEQADTCECRRQANDSFTHKSTTVLQDSS
ncbi:hypothetical protein AVEN_70407-1 [Araneus ventricosus]|uniref:Uncharacterized protein n=1 Tax=Araneus ventricosus TaxID=182803 RepID=A0A4Y2QH75_ARAVE|nr:hypothetical protein AVEN_70407-1 [Araneus ventricosus]